MVSWTDTQGSTHKLLHGTSLNKQQISFIFHPGKQHAWINLWKSYNMAIKNCGAAKMSMVNDWSLWHLTENPFIHKPLDGRPTLIHGNAIRSLSLLRVRYLWTRGTCTWFTFSFRWCTFGWNSLYNDTCNWYNDLVHCKPIGQMRHLWAPQDVK